MTSVDRPTDSSKPKRDAKDAPAPGESTKSTLSEKVADERSAPKTAAPTDKAQAPVVAPADKTPVPAANDKATPPAANKPDASNPDASATRIKTALNELESGHGRSQWAIEKDLRDTLRQHTQAQLGDIEKTLGGKFADLLGKNSHLSAETKEALAVYLKGSDHRSEADMRKLMDSALASKNLHLFREASNGASPEARAQFLKDNGEGRLHDAFTSERDYRQAHDLATTGHVGTLTKIWADKSGAWSKWSDEKGIEAALRQMPEDERTLYQNGTKLAGGQKINGLSDADAERARSFYKDLNKEIESAGNSTQVIAWKQMAADGGAALLGTLAAQRGVLWNGGRSDMSGAIENMSRQDWKYFNDPAHRQERRAAVEKVLSSVADKGDVPTLMAQFDKKVSATDFDKSQTAGQRGILEALQDNTHWYRNDRGSVIDAITKMSPDEQKRYREDAAFKKQVDDGVASVLGSGDSLVEAQRLLQKIHDGQEPSEDVLTKLRKNASTIIGDGAQSLRDIQEAFEKDPKLRDAVLHPTADQKQFSDEFKQLAERAVGHDPDKRALLDELLTKGSMSADKLVQLSNGWITNDYTRAMEDLAKLPEAERQKLLSDPEYRQHTIGFMDAERQKAAMEVLTQGKMGAEDQIYAAVSGTGHSGDVMEALRKLKPEELEHARQEYELKYGGKLEDAVKEKLSGGDLSEASRILVSDKDARAKADEARDEYLSSRSGFGSWFSDTVLRSGTGLTADDAVAGTVKAVSEANKGQDPQSEAAIAESQDRLRGAVDNHRESKDAIASTATDVVIGGVAIGTSIATFGGAVPLWVGVGGTLALGAATKIGGGALFKGNDYDYTALNVVKDAGVGMINAGTALIGPGQIAGLVGKKLVEEAAASELTWAARTVAFARAEGYNVAAGGAGGTAGEAFNGLTQWDPRKSAQENLANIGTGSVSGFLSGGVGAFALGNAFRVVGHATSFFRPSIATSLETAAEHQVHEPTNVVAESTTPRIISQSDFKSPPVAANDNIAPPRAANDNFHPSEFPEQQRIRVGERFDSRPPQVEPRPLRLVQTAESGSMTLGSETEKITASVVHPKNDGQLQLLEFIQSGKINNLKSDTLSGSGLLSSAEDQLYFLRNLSTKQATQLDRDMLQAMLKKPDGIFANKNWDALQPQERAEIMGKLLPAVQSSADHSRLRADLEDYKDWHDTTTDQTEKAAVHAEVLKAREAYLASIEQQKAVKDALIKRMSPDDVQPMTAAERRMVKGVLASRLDAADPKGTPDGEHTSDQAIKIVGKYFGEPMPINEAEKIINQFSDAEKPAVIAALKEQSPFLTQQGLNKQLQKMEQDIEAESDGQFVKTFKDVEHHGRATKGVVAIVLGDSTPGHELAYQFHKATGYTVDIQVVKTRKELLALTGNRGPQGTDAYRAVLFDAMPSSESELSKALQRRMDGGYILRPQVLDDFYKGINIHDIDTVPVSNKGIVTKLRAAIADRPVSAEQAPALPEGTSYAQALHASVEAGRADARSQMELQSLLFFNHQRQAFAKGLPAGVGGKQELGAMFAQKMAKSFSEDVTFAARPNMIEQAWMLHERLLEPRQVTVGGKVYQTKKLNPDGLIFLTDMDKQGSSHFITSLYRRANSLDSAEYDHMFKTLDEVKQLNRDGQLTGKKVVYLDDAIYSGSQITSTVLPKLQQIKTKTHGIGVEIGVLHGYEDGINAVDAAAKEPKRSLWVTITTADGQALPNTANPVNKRLLGAVDLNTDIKRNAFIEVELRAKMNVAHYRGNDKVVARAVFAHQVPNNNAEPLNDLFEKYMKVAGAHVEAPAAERAAVGMRKSELPGVANFRQAGETPLYGGGKPRTEEAYERLSSEKKVDVIIDVNTEPSKDGAIWSAKSTDRRYVHMPLRPRKMTATDLERVADRIDRFVQEGKTVFVNCGRGIDRTGAVMGGYQVRFKGMSPEDAVSEMKNYGYKDTVAGVQHFGDLMSKVEVKVKNNASPDSGSSVLGGSNGFNRHFDELNQAADAAQLQGDLVTARRNLQQILDSYERQGGLTDAQAATTVRRMAITAYRSNNFAEAAQLAGKAVQGFEKLPLENENLIKTLKLQKGALEKQGQLGESAKIDSRIATLEKREQLLKSLPEKAPNTDRRAAQALVLQAHRDPALKPVEMSLSEPINFREGMKPKLVTAHTDKGDLKVLIQHLDRDEPLDEKLAKQSDLIVSCHPVLLPQWAREKHLFPSHTGDIEITWRNGGRDVTLTPSVATSNAATLNEDPKFQYLRTAMLLESKGADLARKFDKDALVAQDFAKDLRRAAGAGREEQEAARAAAKPSQTTETRKPNEFARTVNKADGTSEVTVFAQNGDRIYQRDADGMYTDEAGIRRKFYDQQEANALYSKLIAEPPTDLGELPPGASGQLGGQKRNYKVELMKVLQSEHPQGVELSSREDRLVPKQALILQTDKGEVIVPASTRLPTGTQYDKVSGELITPKAGIRLETGETFLTQKPNLADGTETQPEIVGGQHVKSGNEKTAEAVVVRSRYDDFGNPVYDSYPDSVESIRPDDATEGRFKWKHVAGDTYEFIPNFPREFALMPSGEHTIVPWFSGTASTEGRAVLANVPGKGQYLIGIDELRETFNLDPNSQEIIDRAWAKWKAEVHGGKWDPRFPKQYAVETPEGSRTIHADGRITETRNPSSGTVDDARALPSIAEYRAELGDANIAGDAARSHLPADLSNAQFDSVLTEGRVRNQWTGIGSIALLGEFKIAPETFQKLQNGFSEYVSQLKRAENSRSIADISQALDIFESKVMTAMKEAGIKAESGDGWLLPEYKLPLNSGFTMRDGSTVDLNTEAGLRQMLQDPAPGLLKNLEQELSPVSLDSRARYLLYLKAEKTASLNPWLDPAYVRAREHSESSFTVPLEYRIQLQDRPVAHKSFDSQYQTAFFRLEETLHLLQSLNDERPLTRQGQAIFEALSKPDSALVEYARSRAGHTGNQLETPADLRSFWMENEIPAIWKELGLVPDEASRDMYFRSDPRIQSAERLESGEVPSNRSLNTSNESLVGQPAALQRQPDAQRSAMMERKAAGERAREFARGIDRDLGRLTELSSEAARSGNDTATAQYANQLLKLHNQHGGLTAPEVAEQTTQLAGVALRSGNLSEAERLNLKSISLLERFPLENKRMIASLQLRGEILRKAGRDSETQALAERIEKLQERDKLVGPWQSEQGFEKGTTRGFDLTALGYLAEAAAADKTLQPIKLRGFDPQTFGPNWLPTFVKDESLPGKTILFQHGPPEQAINYEMARQADVIICCNPHLLPEEFKAKHPWAGHEYALSFNADTSTVYPVVPEDWVSSSSLSTYGAFREMRAAVLLEDWIEQHRSSYSDEKVKFIQDYADELRAAALSSMNRTRVSSVDKLEIEPPAKPAVASQSEGEFFLDPGAQSTSNESRMKLGGRNKDDVPVFTNPIGKLGTITEEKSQLGLEKETVEKLRELPGTRASVYDKADNVSDVVDADGGKKISVAYRTDEAGNTTISRVDILDLNQRSGQWEPSTDTRIKKEDGSFKLLRTPGRSGLLIYGDENSSTLGNYLRVEPDGKSLRFFFKFEDGSLSQVSTVLKPDGSLMHYHGDASTVSLNQFGEPLQIVDKNGTAMTFFYSPDGQATKITHGANDFYVQPDDSWHRRDINSPTGLVPFARSIQFKDKELLIKPVGDYRLPIRPHEQVDNIKISPHKTTVTYKPLALPESDYQTPVTPSEKQVLQQRIRSGYLERMSKKTYIHRDTASGASVIYNKGGKVTRIDYGTGRTADLVRDDNNELMAVRYSNKGEPSGAIQKRGDTWVETNAAGAETELYREVSVADDGSIRKSLLGQQNILPDGAVIKRDYAGLLRSRINADGSRVHFSDKDGDIYQINFVRGDDLEDRFLKNRFKPNEPWAWERSHEKGNEKFQGLWVSDEGVVTRVPLGESAEGLKSKVTLDEQQRASTISYPDGRTAKIVRGADGEPIGLEYTKDGQPYTELKQEGAAWSLRDPNGRLLGRFGEVRLEDNGVIGITDRPDWEGTIERPDGLIVKTSMWGRESVAASELGRERDRVHQLFQESFKTPAPFFELPGSKPLRLAADRERLSRATIWLGEFEQRFRATNGQNADAAIANVYYQMDKLLSTGSAVLDKSTRTRLAEQLAYKLAHPEVCQGAFDTCIAAAGIENQLLTRQPNVAARLMAEVATTGKFISGGGMVIDMTRVNGALKPFKEAEILWKTPFRSGSTDDVSTDGSRDFFDQIFQTTAVNAWWQDEGRQSGKVINIREGNYKPSDVQYELGHAPHSPNGEYVVDYSGEQPVIKRTAEEVNTVHPMSGQMSSIIEVRATYTPDLTADQIITTHIRISGQDLPILATGMYKGGRTTNVDSAEQLAQSLMDPKKKGKLPASIMVDGRDATINLEKEDLKRGRPHLINVQAIRAVPGPNGTRSYVVDVTNQWGERYNFIGDKAMSLDDLWKAMQPRPTETVTTPNRRTVTT